MIHLKIEGQLFQDDWKYRVCQKKTTMWKPISKWGELTEAKEIYTARLSFHRNYEIPSS